MGGIKSDKNFIENNLANKPTRRGKILRRIIPIETRKNAGNASRRLLMFFSPNKSTAKKEPSLESNQKRKTAIIINPTSK
tara:strand:+ start:213 stop:452 length:240 start_codon:yes stop_codon:yes gene_type:complete